MARRSAKVVLDKIIELLDTPAPLDYLKQKVCFYENEIEKLQDEGETFNPPCIWVVYQGSTYLRTDIDNAWVHNQSFTFGVIVYDHSYSGARKAAEGVGGAGGRPGTLDMIYDVHTRLDSVKAFQDTMPFLPISEERIVLDSVYISAHLLIFNTEFDYGAPA